jgi:hypothetical protein
MNDVLPLKRVRTALQGRPADAFSSAFTRSRDCRQFRCLRWTKTCLCYPSRRGSRLRLLLPGFKIWAETPETAQLGVSLQILTQRISYQMSLRNAASSWFIRVGVGIGVDIGISILDADSDPDIVSSDAVLPMTVNLNFKYFCLAFC